MTPTVDFPPLKRKSELNLAHFTENCHRYHDLVRDFHGERPEIVVLCGSSRFSTEFTEANYTLTLQGFIVLTIGCDTKSGLGRALGDEAKAALDVLHKRKIDLADRVVVVSDSTGYYGDSTRSEIAYAEKHNKPVHYAVEQLT